MQNCGDVGYQWLSYHILRLKKQTNIENGENQ